MSVPSGTLCLVGFGEKKGQEVCFFFKEGSLEEKVNLSPSACPLLGDVPSVTTREQ